MVTTNSSTEANESYVNFSVFAFLDIIVFELKYLMLLKDYLVHYHLSPYMLFTNESSEA